MTHVELALVFLVISVLLPWAFPKLYATKKSRPEGRL